MSALFIDVLFPKCELFLIGSICFRKAAFLLLHYYRLILTCNIKDAADGTGHAFLSGAPDPVCFVYHIFCVIFCLFFSIFVLYFCFASVLIASALFYLFIYLFIFNIFFLFDLFFLPLFSV